MGLLKEIETLAFGEDEHVRYLSKCVRWRVENIEDSVNVRGVGAFPDRIRLVALEYELG